MLKYPVIIEKANENYSAYCPDLPGCVATGATIKEAVEQIKKAIQFHLEGMKIEGLVIPEPSARIIYIEVRV